MEELKNLTKFKEIRVCWCRKSNVGEEHPFDVTFEINEEESEVVKDIYIFNVGVEEYDKLAKTLDDFETLAPEDEKYFKQYFVITDGSRWLAIDNEGYNYPRYKSAVCYKGEVLPF